MDWLVVINLIAVALLGAAALRWGAAPERICAATLFLVTFGDPVYHALAGQAPVYGSVDIAHLVMDLGVAALFTGVALWANRIYPLWLAAFQLVSVIAHFARELTMTFPKLAYGLMSYGPFYIILLIMAGGIIAQRARTRRHGTFRSWRDSSNPSQDRAPLPRRNDSSGTLAD